MEKIASNPVTSVAVMVFSALRKPHFSAERHLSAERACICRKMHVSEGKCIFNRRTHFSGGCSGGLRIMGGSLSLDEV